MLPVLQQDKIQYPKSFKVIQEGCHQIQTELQTLKVLLRSMVSEWEMNMRAKVHTLKP